MKKIYLLGIGALLSASTIFYSGCGKNGINIFSINNDIELGLQTKAQIEADPAQSPILNPQFAGGCPLCNFKRPALLGACLRLQNEGSRFYNVRSKL